VGVVDVHWDVVEKKLDLTGDEKFDEKDVKVASNNALRFLARVRHLSQYVKCKEILCREFRA